MVAYLPVVFEAEQTEPAHKSKEAGSRSLLKVDILRAHHESTEICLKQLQIVVENGFSIERRNGQKRPLYFGGLSLLPAFQKQKTYCL